MSGTPEFSRPVRLARIGLEPLRREIAADAGERDALARRFDLLGLDRLTAEVTLTRRSADLILLHATFEAAFVQECVATLDPIETALAAEFELLYGPPEAEEAAAGLLSDAVAFEPLSGDAIDIGEAVAQELSLALPPFPRSPAADAAVATTGDEPGAFAALARLFDRPDRSDD
jgi:uncharacterized metal-binding protein YceD (DUF177 family)